MVSIHGKLFLAMESGPLSSLIYPLKMVMFIMIFHGDVGLPKGKSFHTLLKLAIDSWFTQ